MDARSKFQVERIALFSDAVFAIAITLMIIEVKPPHLHHDISNYEALGELLKLTPMFFGVILSFTFIGLFWLRHHQLMKHMENYSHKLLGLNLAFLLTIVFIPFSTAFVFENTLAGSAVPMVFYNVNYILAAWANYRLFAYVLKPENGIMAADNPERISQHRFDLLFPIAVYILVLIVACINTPLSPLFYAAFGLQGLLSPDRKRRKAAARAGDAKKP